MRRYPFILIIIIVEISLVFANTFTKGIQCYGYCTKDPEMCKSRGGKIIGLCTNALACCDPLVSSMATCGETKLGQSVHFKSPAYPVFHSGDLNCDVRVKLRNDTVGIRVDFIIAEMDGQSFLEADDESGSCDSDFIFLRGFGSWAPPPRCGNLSGYSFLIEKWSVEARGMKVLSVVALMSSPSYRWHIRVLQLSRREHSKNGVLGEKASLDYELSFKEKRSLLTPNVKPPDVFTDDDTLTFDEEVSSEYDMAEPWQFPMILNGKDAVIALVPWQASLRLKLPTSSTDQTLSALKADNPGNPENRVISNCSKSDGRTVFMEHDSVSRDSKGIASYEYDVESITLHYGFDNQLIINDIALIRLKTRIKTFDHIQLIRMAKSGDDFVGKEALLSGWGDTEAIASGSNSSTLDFEELDPDSHVSPNILQASNKFVIQNQSFCNAIDAEQYSATATVLKRHPKYTSVFNSTLCTSSKEDNETDKQVSAGRGDSGGGLIVEGEEEGTPILVGVVSYGIAPDEPENCKSDPDGWTTAVDYFASVAFYRDWIDLAISSYDNVLMHNM